VNVSRPARPNGTSVAEAYEEHMVPGMFAWWSQLIVALADPRPGEHVLDVACGTGIGARLAARAVGSAGRVAGLDIDPGVVEIAAKVTDGAASPMDWHCGSALEMPFKDGEFDLCLCLQGMQFFPDRLAGLAEIRRVVKRSGRFVGSLWASLEFNEGHRAVVQALERQNVDASSARRACSFADVDDIRDIAKRAGFSNVELRTEDGVSHFASLQSFIDGMTLGSPSTRHAVALLPPAGRDRFVRDVSTALEQYIVGGELQYPMRTHIVVARP